MPGHGTPLTPVQAAAESAEQAQAWIGAAPPLACVLDWHRELCGACNGLRHCPEYAEIITEYGAGTCGITVFWPGG